MILYVDIDQTIAITPSEDSSWDYTKSKPRSFYIKKINSLFEEGHEIVYWTARGSSSGKDWSSLTKSQLEEWGCKYTRLETLKKPSFDLFIDDKAITIEKL